jgi:hypothetical protein
MSIHDEHHSISPLRREHVAPDCAAICDLLVAREADHHILTCCRDHGSLALVFHGTFSHNKRESKPNRCHWCNTHARQLRR